MCVRLPLECFYRPRHAGSTGGDPFGEGGPGSCIWPALPLTLVLTAGLLGGACTQPRPHPIRGPLSPPRGPTEATQGESGNWFWNRPGSAKHAQTPKTPEIVLVLTVGLVSQTHAQYRAFELCFPFSPAQEHTGTCQGVSAYSVSDRPDGAQGAQNS